MNERRKIGVNLNAIYILFHVCWGGIHGAYARDILCGVMITLCSSIILAKISGVDFAWFPQDSGEDVL